MTNTRIDRVIGFIGAESDLLYMQHRYGDSLFIHLDGTLKPHSEIVCGNKLVHLRLALIGVCDQLWYTAGTESEHLAELVFCKHNEIKIVPYLPVA